MWEQRDGEEKQPVSAWAARGSTWRGRRQHRCAFRCFFVTTGLVAQRSGKTCGLENGTVTVPPRHPAPPESSSRPSRQSPFGFTFRRWTAEDVAPPRALVRKMGDRVLSVRPARHTEGARARPLLPGDGHVLGQPGTRSG